MIQCWNCKKKVEELKVGFRSECEHCHVDLHTCKGCRHYKLGKPNDCNVPGTEFVRDRDRRNFCEDFEVLGAQSAEKQSLDEVMKKFDQLFKDP